jgi:hypothetical protein
MATLVTRSGKGSPLTHNEVDANFINLNTDKLELSGGTMTGVLTLDANPTLNLHAATKQYVDTIAAAGIHYHDPVRVESPVNLNATYDNGASGVGATLTNAGTLAAITVDGVALSLNDRVLVYEQTDATQNGVYTVTTVGDGSTAWVLTRATDADSYGASDPDALGEGDAFFVKEGDTGAGELYVMNTTGSITFGTTNITFSVIAETAVYSAGTGLTLDGTTFSTVRDIATNIPASLGTAGQILSVNEGETAAEWADSSGGGGLEYLTGSTALVAGGQYLLNIASNVTLTLPASPTTGSIIRIVAANGIDDGYTLTVARNGATISSLSEDLSVDTHGLDFIMWYNGTTWSLI